MSRDHTVLTDDGLDRQPLDADLTTQLLALLAARDRLGALAFVNTLRAAGTSSSQIIEQLLSPAQRRVGELWEAGEWSVSQEHAATAIVEAVLAAIPDPLGPCGPGVSVVLACCEHEWHSLPARMLADLLRARGWDVTFLGASTAADDLGEFLRLTDPVALIISCSVSMNLFGAARLIDSAHASGYRVLIGGAALPTAQRADALGADGWAISIEEADRILTDWRTLRRPPRPVFRPGGPAAWAIANAESQLVEHALNGLRSKGHWAVLPDQGQLNRARADITYIVAFASAAILASDDSVFHDFVDWLNGILTRTGTSTFTLAAFDELMTASTDHSALTELLVRSADRQNQAVHA